MVRSCVRSLNLTHTSTAPAASKAWPRACHLLLWTLFVGCGSFLAAEETAPSNGPTANSPANQPTDNQPTDNQPTDNQPTDNQPTDNEPADQQPAANPASTKQPAANRSSLSQLRTALNTAAANNQFREVVEKASQILQAEPTLTDQVFAYYHRGRAHFCLNQLHQSLADFDQMIKLDPARERQLWERGIVQYYLEDFAGGSRQFELYQTYYDQDVENSVWRFLCQRYVDGTERAREQMLPIDRDPRVPLMAIYHLYRGKGSVDDVWSQVNSAGGENGDGRRSRHFFAHLYLGLYYEALGEADRSAEHIRQAVEDYGDDPHYMWQVAKVHQQVRQQKPAPPLPAAPAPK